MKNKQLTKNFSLHELMYATLNEKGRQMNDKAISLMSDSDKEELFTNFQKIANKLQKIRDKYNLPISINSGYRCRDWELFRGRSGRSQHVLGKAVDFHVVCKDNEKYNEIMKNIMKDCEHWMGGLAECTSQGNYIFIHIDIRIPNAQHIKRGFGARWTY